MKKIKDFITIKWFGLINYYYNRRNNILWQKLEDENFLESLCIKNTTLDLDKYLKLMKMVKRKYRK